MTAKPKLVSIHPDRDLEDEDAPLRLVRSAKRCIHFKHRYKLDKETQRAFCRDCDAEVSLWHVLESLSSDFERYVRTRNEALRRMQEAERRLAETLRLERNARGRVVRADASLKAKLPSIPWGEGGAA